MTLGYIKPAVLGPKGRTAVLFFAESPGMEDRKSGQACTGSAGQLLRRIIEAELPDKRVVLDHVYPLYVGRDKPGIEMLREYDDYRAESIAEHKPQVIVLLGAVAQKAFTLGGQTVRQCGKVATLNGLPVVLSVAPSYVLMGKGEEMHLLERVFRVIKACLQRGTSNTRSYLGCTVEWERVLPGVKDKLCGFDIETSSLKATDGRMLTAALATGDEVIWTDIAYNPETQSVEQEQKLVALMQWWSNGPRVVHNLKMECSWMRRAGAADPGELYDTMLQAWLLDENQPRGLDYLLPAELGVKPYWTDLPRDGKYEGVPLGRLGSYNADDARYTLALHHHQRQRMTDTQKHLADDLFIPLTKLLLTMEERGVYVDRDELETLTTDHERALLKQQKVVERRYPGLNPASPDQLRELLYGTMGLKPPHHTKKHQASTDAEALAQLAEENPELADLAAYRKALRFQSSVLEPFEKLSRVDSRLHSTFNFVTTGRLSSSGPNLQNVDREGRQRFCMRSRFGKRGRIIQADYNQHEMRVFAAEGQCLPLLELFRDPKADMHTLTAERISKLGIRCDRTQAKRVNFGILYDITEHGLAKKSHIPAAEGRKLLAGWHSAFPELKALHARVDAEFKQHGWVENMFGLRRRLERPHDPHERRQAYNFPIQSAAVMISYHAMLSLEEEMRKRRMKSLLVLQIHDSIVVDAAPGEVTLTERLMTKHMLAVKTPCGVPLAVDVKVREHL